MTTPARSITWKVHLGSPPERVHRLLTTAEGRSSFWAASAEERDGAIEFRFTNGEILRSRVLHSEPPRALRLTYFNESTVTFRLEPDGSGGTDLVLTEEGVSEESWAENLAGWVSVLLNLKAVADHGVDLRSHDPERTWKARYVDV